MTTVKRGRPISHRERAEERQRDALDILGPFTRPGCIRRAGSARLREHRRSPLDESANPPSGALVAHKSDDQLVPHVEGRDPNHCNFLLRRQIAQPPKRSRIAVNPTDRDMQCRLLALQSLQESLCRGAARTASAYEYLDVCARLPSQRTGR